MDKEIENLKIEWALALSYSIREMREKLIVYVGFILLPIMYVLQDGWIAGLWLLGGGSFGLLASFSWKQTRFQVKVFSVDLEFNEITKKYMEEIYSESRSWIIGILSLLYVLLLMFLFPGGNSGTKFPNGPVVMLLLAGFCAVCVFFTIQALDFVKAFDPKRIAKAFNIPEQILVSRLKPKVTKDQPTFSANVLTVLLSCIGATAFLYGVIWMISWLIGVPEPIFGAFRSGYVGTAPGLVLIIFGAGTLLVGYGIRKMSRMAAVFALFLAFGTGSTFLFIIVTPNLPGSAQLLWVMPKPSYINLTWVLGIPSVICILVWRNWKKMHWPEEMKYLYTPWEG